MGTQGAVALITLGPGESKTRVQASIRAFVDEWHDELDEDSGDEDEGNGGFGELSQFQYARTDPMGDPSKRWKRPLRHDYYWPNDTFKVVGVDVETTGINRGRDRITQIGFCGNTMPRTSILIDPMTSTGNDPSRIKGVTAEEIQNMKPIAHHLDFIFDTMEGAVVVGHNIQHDMAFIEHEFRRHHRQPPIPDRIVCTLTIVKQLKHEGGKSLKALLTNFNIPLLRWHNAGHDAKGHFQLFIALANMYWHEFFRRHFHQELELVSKDDVRADWLYSARMQPPPTECTCRQSESNHKRKRKRD